MTAIPYKKLHAAASTPVRAHGGPHSDAGFDLCACKDYCLLPGETVAIETGIAIQLPRDDQDWVWEAQVRPRSSMRKKGVVASLGTIDAGYRGEIGCILHNLSREPYFIQVRDKVCQLVVSKKPAVVFVETTELDETERGDKRYGSSGK